MIPVQRRSRMCGPSFLGTVTTATYDGTTDDLLTAGLGWDGLQSATAPALSATPTARELRRRAIYSELSRASRHDYRRRLRRAVWPQRSARWQCAQHRRPARARLAGTEYLAYSVDATGKAAATLMVQIPFNVQSKRCRVS